MLSIGTAEEEPEKLTIIRSVPWTSYHDPSCNANIMSVPAAECYEKWQSVNSFPQLWWYIYYLLLNKTLWLFWIFLYLFLNSPAFLEQDAACLSVLHAAGDSCSLEMPLFIAFIRAFLSVTLLMTVFFVRCLSGKHVMGGESKLALWCRKNLISLSAARIIRSPRSVVFFASSFWSARDLVLKQSMFCSLHELHSFMSF